MTSDTENTDSALGPYRALDLTEGGFNWCGKALADLGADVIKVEPTGGSPTRHLGPFYQDHPDPERSLYWYAYCLNKRGVTLDLESHRGRELFKQLVISADFVLESFAPGYLDSLGLGYEDLSKIKPGLVMTSMTPYGQTGPYAHYKATDIVAWAMGGMQYISGDEDRSPVRVSFPQAELHAGARGAAGSMVAFWHRQMTGEGQHVDVSMQASVVWTTMNTPPFPKLHKTNVERAGSFRMAGPVARRAVWRCKDGYVSANAGGGVLGGRSMAGIVRWMDQEGMAPDFMKETNWVAWDVNGLVAKGEEGIREIEEVQVRVAGFFATKTKAELYERAITDRVLLAPCNTVQDVCDSPQLKARDFWIEVYHPELAARLTYLGPYIKLSETPIEVRRRAPLIGEHNEEIYVGELGLDKAQIAQLKEQGTV